MQTLSKKLIPDNANAENMMIITVLEFEVIQFREQWRFAFTDGNNMVI